MAKQSGRKKKAAGATRKSGRASKLTTKLPANKTARAGDSPKAQAAASRKKSMATAANASGRARAKVAAKSSAKAQPKSGVKVGGVARTRKEAGAAAVKKGVSKKLAIKKAAGKVGAGQGRIAASAKKSRVGTTVRGSSMKRPSGKRSAPAGKKRAGAASNASELLDLQCKLQHLRQEIEELGVEMDTAEDSDMSEELEEAFLESVLEVETAGWSRPYDLLLESGISLPKPQDLGNAELSAKLWEVINALALVSVYLDRTDHLDDRELYTHLWNESLREEMIIIPHNPGFQSHIDVIGSGSDEDTTIWLRYYADSEDRQDWSEQFPEFIMPEREQPLYDRDKLLPRPGRDHMPGVH